MPHPSSCSSCLSSLRAPRKLRDIQPGEHVCLLYSTPEEHKQQLTEYLKRGIELNQKVVYFGDINEKDVVWSYLREQGIDIEECTRRGQVAYAPATEVYLTNNVFDPQKMRAFSIAAVDAALKEGWSALRATGEMSWALRGFKGSNRLLEYEALLNTVIPSRKVMAMCQYNVNLWHPSMLTCVLQTHPMALLDKQTDLIDNIYYMKPEEFLAPKEQVPFHVLRQWLTNLKNHQALISQLTQRTQDLECALKRAEDATRAQAAFLAIAR